MNMKYASMPEYHWVAFSLLVSAGICYLSSQYKFTLDANTPKGLRTCQVMVFVQLALNWLTRVVIWFPSAYGALHSFYQLGGWSYFCGGCFGMLGISLYNIVVVMDARSAAKKCFSKTLKESLLQVQ